MDEPQTGRRLVKNITPGELKSLLEGGSGVLVLDVREPYEFDHANIGGILIPLGQLTNRWKELEKEKHIVVLCHHGNRSRVAAQFLLDQGFPKVDNLAGGIEAWSQTVDPRIPRY